LLAELGERAQVGARQSAAVSLSRAGDHARAAAVLGPAVAARPNDAALREFLGDEYFQAGDAPGAREQYLWLLSAGAASTSVCNKLAAVAEGLGDHATVVRALERSVARDPTQHGAWNLLGAAYGRTGDLRRARACFERALAIRPDFAPAQRNLERVKAMQK
jgi:predicted Zn-dependent protease